MAVFDAGIFILLSGIAFVFFLIKFEEYPFFRLIAMLLFAVLVFPLVADYSISYNTTITGGNCTPNCVVTKDLISNGTPLFGVVLGLIYLLFAIISVILFFQEYFAKMQEIADKIGRGSYSSVD